MNRILLALTALLLAPLASMAGSLELVNDAATGGPGKFAAAEIRREAAAKGVTLGKDAKATRIEITVGKAAKAAETDEDGKAEPVTKGSGANGFLVRQ